MKKILFAIALVMIIGVGANAQKSDGFFRWNDADNNDNYRGDTPSTPAFALPTAHGYANDQQTPLGSGLLILTALGAGYALARKRNEE